MAYVLEALLGEIVKIAVFLAIALVFNCVVEMTAVLVGYMLMRIFTGGPHCTSYMRCLILGIVSFTPLALISYKIDSQTILAFVVILSTLFSTFAIFQWVPGHWHQRKLKRPKEYYQNASTILLIIFHSASTVILLSNNVELYSVGLAVQLGIIWQVTNVSPIGYKLVHIADRFMINAFSIFHKGGTVHDES